MITVTVNGWIHIREKVGIHFSKHSGIYISVGTRWDTGDSHLGPSKIDCLFQALGHIIFQIAIESLENIILV